MRALFVEQGRAMEGAAMGLVRVLHAVRAGLEEAGGEVELDELSIRPFTRGERRFVRYVPGLEGGGFGSVRWHLARGWVARREIEERLRERPADVVHLITGQISLLLGDLAERIPVVPSLDTLTVDWARTRRRIPREAETPRYLKPLGVLEKRALARAPLSIAWTETVADAIRTLAPTAPIAVLHPGIDLRAFRPSSAERRSGPARVLFVGGRWVDKGGPQLIEALRPELGRTVELDVVTTRELEPLDGVRVHRGAPGSGTVADLFARADVFCLPTFSDATPFVVTEAMASGVPVISTRLNSIPELVGEAGLLVDPGDVDGLRGALEALLTDPARRADMGAAGRARAEAHYDARKNTARLMELLREVAR
jgi:glycosyltransferase involved in cell wall biosynthesis